MALFPASSGGGNKHLHTEDFVVALIAESGSFGGYYGAESISDYINLYGTAINASAVDSGGMACLCNVVYQSNKWYLTVDGKNAGNTISCKVTFYKE